MLVVVAVGALAAYALSRVRIPGRDAILYGLLLLSSIVTGTAAMVPIFQLMFQLNLIDTRLGRHPRADRRPAAGGDLHPQGLHGRHARRPTRSRRGSSAPARCRSCGTSCCRSCARAWRRSPCGRSSTCGATSSCRSSCCATRTSRRPAVIDVHLLHRGRAGRTCALHLGVLAALLAAGRACMFLFVNRRYGFRFHGGIKR